MTEDKEMSNGEIALNIRFKWGQEHQSADYSFEDADALEVLIKEALDQKDSDHQKSFQRLTMERDDLKEALHCYALNFPCPGFEVGIGAGETSGCNGTGNDCPTCEAIKL